MLYDYICDKCKKKYEIVKRVKDSSNEETCICGNTMRKLFNIVSIKTGDGYKN